MTEQEKTDIALVSWGGEGENMFPSLPYDRRTEAVSLRAVETWEGNIKYVPEEVLSKRICLAAVRENGEILERVPERLRTPDVCLAAVQNRGLALEYVPEKLRTRRICSEAARNDCRALDYVPQARHTRRLYRKALEKDALAIRHFKPELLTREMCYEAFSRTDGLRVLRYVPFPDIHEEILADHHGYREVKEFLDDMNPEYMTPKLAEMIFMKEPELFFNIPDHAKDRDLCEAAVRYDGSYLRIVPEALKTPELCREAIRHSPYAIRHIPESMKTPELYRELVAENPRNLHGIPEKDRTYELCKTAFDNTYGKDKTDYSVAGALVEPSMTLQMVREQDDPRKIDFLMDIMCSKAISEEVALEAVRKNGEVLHRVPRESITPQVGEAAVGNHPEAIRWVPREMRTADMCLRAVAARPDMEIYVPEHIAKGDNIYSFRAEADDLIRRPLGYDDYKRLYAGEAAHVPDVRSPGGSMGPCRVYFDTRKRHFIVEQSDDQPQKKESRSARSLHVLFTRKSKAGPKHKF